MALSVDAFASHFLPRPHVSDGVDYYPEQAVVKCIEHYNPQAENLTIIIPPWHANQAVQNRLIAKQVKLGNSVLAYTFHDDMLTADADLTIRSFEAIGDRIAADIVHYDELPKHFIAASLGTAVLPFVLGEYGIVARATAITPGGDLATSLWTGIRTQHLRLAFEEQGLHLGDLRNHWRRLSPSYQALVNIRGCDFRMFISQADKVILPGTNQALIDTLRLTGNTVTADYNRFMGHYGTILYRSVLNNL